MRRSKSNLLIPFFFTVIVIIPLSLANIAQWDEVWQKRAEQARRNYNQAYHPEPENVTSDLVKAVHGSVKSSPEPTLNGTRRQLGKIYRGPCMATNPIDQCWRCNQNWAANRKRLADCVMGFGRNAKGGKDGAFYIVNDSSDDLVNPKPGTLRHAVIQKRPLWITFAHDMVIRLNAELIMQGDKTIDARGARVFIHGGAGITIQFVKNIIIHGIRIFKIFPNSPTLIKDGEDHISRRGSSDGDGITIYGSSDIWIDHVSMKKCYDGLIDVLQGSTAITITNCHFTDHNDVMLFGAQDSHPDDKMQITLAFNHFGKRLIQRMPRCRFGYVHVINNDYTHWELYAIGGNMHPTIISQGNRYIAANDTLVKEVTHRQAPESQWKYWSWTSEADLFINGAYFTPSGDQNWLKKHRNMVDGVSPVPGTHAAWLTKFSGALNCFVGQKC